VVDAHDARPHVPESGADLLPTCSLYARQLQRSACRPVQARAPRMSLCSCVGRLFPCAARRLQKRRASRGGCIIERERVLLLGMFFAPRVPEMLPILGAISDEMPRSKRHEAVCSFGCF
jgi:hypothetical protein